MHQWHHANDRAVFYANYSTKFAIWDWLFGTAYLPGRKKPAEFGLYYDYPKDYFLQHLFAVKKVDEKKLVEKYAWFRAYYFSRLRVTNWISTRMGLRKIDGLVPKEGLPVKGPSLPVGGNSVAEPVER
jgi:hypothetical protein